MKRPHSFLNLTTALVVSVTLVGSNIAHAARGLPGANELAQATTVPSTSKAQHKAKKDADAVARASEAAAILARKVVRYAADEGAVKTEAAAAEAQIAAKSAVEATAQAAADARQPSGASAEALEKAAAATRLAAEKSALVTVQASEEGAKKTESVAERAAEATAKASKMASDQASTAAQAVESQTPATRMKAKDTARHTDGAPNQGKREKRAEKSSTAGTGTVATAGAEVGADTGAAAGSDDLTQTAPGAGTEQSSNTATTSKTDPAPQAGTLTESRQPSKAERRAEKRRAEKTDVSEKAVREATESGKDVVVEEKTSTEALAAIEKSRKAARKAAASIDEQKPIEVQNEVVTKATTRTSNEEVKVATSLSNNQADASSTKTDESDNQLWKYLGAALAGAVVGTQVPALGGRLVQDQGDRAIVERDGEFYVSKDENLLLRRPGVTVQTEEFTDGIVRTTVNRKDGSKVVTVRDAGGFVLKRTRILPDGTHIALIDESRYVYEPRQPSVDYGQAWSPRATNTDPRYVVNYGGASRDVLRRTLTASPVHELDRVFSLRDVRENESVRALVPRIDLDTVHFASGSVAIGAEQAGGLEAVGRTMANIISANPREVFLIEGHTDAVGSNLMNLALSDRRAETVALALTEYFYVPPENLVVQGYGERYLKVNTQESNQANRRATVRRITPLMDRGAWAENR